MSEVKFQETLNDMVKFVLIQKDGTESIRKLIQKKFGFSNSYEMITWVKREKNCSLEMAKQIILSSPTLMKIMFVMA